MKIQTIKIMKYQNSNIFYKLRTCLKEIELYKIKLLEKENLLNSIKTEHINVETILQKQLKEKDSLIICLQKELEQLKNERNDSKQQIQNIIKDNKFAVFNNRTGSNNYKIKKLLVNKKLNSHQASITSMASISTNNFEDKHIEILTNEKNLIEKQLIDYKLRYAESNSKLTEVEEENIALKKTNSVKLKFKIRTY